MKLAEWIDRAIEPFDPARVRRRIGERMALQMMRDYDVAAGGRRNQNWRRVATSADREGQKAQAKARDAGYDLVRNNKYASAIDIHLTAQLVGDGIAPRAVHRVKSVQKRAQAEIDAFFRSKVDGRRDFFGIQKLATSAMIVGGESLIVWGADADGPDGRCRVLEGAFLDAGKNRDVAGQNRIVQGVEFDAEGFRVAYWLFDRHPGDALGRVNPSRRYEAGDVDHVYDERRPGQTRGISWLAPVAVTLREYAETTDAKLMKEKIAACLALVLSAPDNGAPPGPFDEAGVVGAAASGAGSESRPVDTVRPGMVMRARAGEHATVVNPPASGEGVGVMRQELMGVAATTIPYHILTGDPSQANYSSLRALTNPFHTRLDDVQQNILVPFICTSATERRMRRLALRTGERRFNEVTFTWGMPLRRTNDPIKDFAGELMEIRAGTKAMTKALTERGLNPEEHAQALADWYALTDDLKLALDSDPRRVNGAGSLQPPAGYLYSSPQGT